MAMMNCQGYHETEESEDGEAGLQLYQKDCKKNPDHLGFYGIDEFTLNHLPDEFQVKEMYEYIKALFDLTVRIGVEVTSPDRPQFWPKTTKRYPFHGDKKTKLRTGSGKVIMVNVFKDGVCQSGGHKDSNYKLCWCKKCEVSESPSNVWWELYIVTATHVMFDDTEAKETTVRLFYDREDSPVVVVDKINVDYVNIEYDRCKLRCVTCDNRVGDRLKTIWEQCDDVWRKVFYKYSSSRDSQKLALIVSHPHGCSKKISVGQWKGKYNVGRFSKFWYTTSTCPGSSGATVHLVGYSGWRWSEFVHSGSLKSGLNYSGIGRA